MGENHGIVTLEIPHPMNGSILVPPGLQISCFGDIAEVGAKFL